MTITFESLHYILLFQYEYFCYEKLRFETISAMKQFYPESDPVIFKSGGMITDKVGTVEAKIMNWTHPDGIIESFRDSHAKHSL